MATAVLIVIDFELEVDGEIRTTACRILDLGFAHRGSLINDDSRCIASKTRRISSGRDALGGFAGLVLCFAGCG